MPERAAHSYSSYPASDWFTDFKADLRVATDVSIGTGFLDVRGVTDLLAAANPATSVRLLVSAQGCSIEAAERVVSRAVVRLRGTRSPDFHWKTALITTPAGHVMWVGSANYTGKGIGGAGEMALRLAGAALPTHLWNEVCDSFERYYTAPDVLEGTALLSEVRRLADARRQLELAEDNLQHLAVATSKNTAESVEAWFMTWEQEFEDEELDRILQDLKSNHSEHEFAAGDLSADERKRMSLGSTVLAFVEADEVFTFASIQKFQLLIALRKQRWVACLKLLSDPISKSEHPGPFLELKSVLSTAGAGRLVALPKPAVERLRVIFKNHSAAVRALRAVTDNAPPEQPYRGRKLPR